MTGTRARVTAAAAAALVLAEVVVAVVASAAAGWSFQDALDAFVVSNSVIGLSFGLCGALVAWHRPANPVGWLMAGAGFLHALSAAVAPVGQVLADEGAPEPVVRVLATVFMGAWPWAIGLLLPVFLILFPDGRLMSRAWRWAVVAIVVTAPLFVASGFDGTPLLEGYPRSYLTISSYDDLEPLWVLAEVRTLGAILLGVVALGLRYRRADDEQRLQLLWLLLAAVLMLIVIVPWSFVAGTPVVVLFSIPLLPLAVAVAVVRHRLLDIRLVVSRVLTWVLLSALVVGAYVALVAVLDGVVSQRLGRSAAATLIVALAVSPVLRFVQRHVNRALYGDRRDPARVVSAVGSRLSAGSEAGLHAVPGAVRSALKVPYVALRLADQVVAEAGAGVGGEELSLEYAGRQVGSLVVAPRNGERTLSATDRDVLRLLSTPLAVALHATALTAQLQAAGARLVAAREDERSRVRRDLHDGLGPHLTGVAMKADAAANLLHSDPARAAEIVHALGRDTRQAIAEVRRVVDDLRPASLDELGLVAALYERVEQLTGVSPLRVALDVPEAIPDLPPAVEVAAFRIATEALNNVVRHSSAGSATVRLRVADGLDVEVVDDGDGRETWRPGVGLQAMRERARQLGGSFEAGPTELGGRVRATLPLGVA